MSSFNRVYFAPPDIIELLQSKYTVCVRYKNENKMLIFEIFDIEEYYFETFFRNVCDKTTYETEILKLLSEHGIIPYDKFMAQLQVHYEFYN